MRKLRVTVAAKTIIGDFDQLLGPAACLLLPSFKSLPYTAMKEQKARGVAQWVKPLPCKDTVTMCNPAHKRQRRELLKLAS